MNKILKAVILAAGMGTRMKPITRVIPKEMLPLGRKPVLQYIVEELQAGGIGEILFVTREDKPAIEEYFDSWKGVSFIQENQARGSGYAILISRDFINQEDFIVAGGDAPIGGKKAAFLIPDLIQTHVELKAAATMAIYQIPRSETNMRGIMDPIGEVTPGKPVILRDMVEKPDPETAPSTWAGVGRYIFNPVIFNALEEVKPDANGEVQLTDGIRLLAQSGKPFFGFPLQEGQIRFDTGNIKGYVEAFRYFSEREDKNSLL